MFDAGAVIRRDHGSMVTFSLVFLSLLGVLLVLYTVSLALYRLTKHPLARFPGPRLAAITKWYECFHDTCQSESGQYAWRIRDMHDKYGPIVRVAPDEIHIRDPKFFGTLYAPSPARRDKYPPAAAMNFAPLGTFGTVMHDVHRKRRLASSPLFSRANLLQGHQLIYERVELLCKSLERAYQSQQVLHAHTLTLALATDVMSAFILKEPFGCQTDETLAVNWNKTMETLPRLIPYAKQFPWVLSYAIELPQSVIDIFLPKIATVVRLYKMMYEESRLHASSRDEKKIVAEKIYPQEERPTIFDIIDRSSLPLKEKDIARQAQEAFVLIAAGTETTARVLVAVLYHLIANPHVYTTLRQELKNIMPSLNDKPDVAVLEAQPYFTAVIKEGLRVMQLMTSRFPLIAPNDMDYEGWSIPAGTPISMTISEVLSDPVIYPEPDTFKPERWLDEDGKLHSHLDRYFVAFGRGTRMCQGKDFAWAELYVCLSQLVRKFNFDLHDTIRSRDVDVVSDLFLGTSTERSLGVRLKVASLETE